MLRPVVRPLVPPLLRPLARALGLIVLTATLVQATPATSAKHASAAPVDTATLELWFLDVGQGDAVLIRAPDGRAVLYDGGEDRDRTLRLLERAGVRSLELVIASHNHADHIGGLPAVIERYRPRYVLENGVPHTTRAYERFLRAMSRSGAQRLSPGRRTITLDSVRLTILPPPPGGGDQNTSSVGLRIDYGGFEATLLGDSEPEQQRWWLATHPDLLAPVEVHKASHHGSRNGDTASLLASLSPEVVVIGVGGNNSYGHPHASALRLYREAGADVVRTDRHGTLVVTAPRDGSYAVRGEGAVAGAVDAASEAAAARSPAPADPQSSPSPACVNVNRAGRDALIEIIHIGPERAGQILRLRRQRPFASVRDLVRVRGIGPARIRDITREGLACVRSG